MTFLGKEWLGVTGLGSSACKIPSCFHPGSAELAPALICGGGSNTSGLRRRFGSSEPHLPHQIPYSPSGYGGGPDRCVVKVPGIVPGKIPKPASISGKTTKSMARNELEASEVTAARQEAMEYKVDVLEREMGDMQKQMSGIKDQINRLETLMQGLMSSQTRATEQSNLESIQGIQLRRTPEGNFKFPSTGPSVVVTGWDDDPLPHAVIASPTLNNMNPSHGPEMAKDMEKGVSAVAKKHAQNASVGQIMNLTTVARVSEEVVSEQGERSNHPITISYPFTHNLPKDIMPADLDWSIDDKHAFIEESGDRRIAKMCFGILEAMKSHPEYNYVAYRKGIGVVCNKKSGAHFHEAGCSPYNLQAQMLPKSHHCYFIRLMLEYFKFSSLDADESSACKYVILSKKVLAVFVVMNSTVSSSKEPGNIVFQTLTDAQNFYAMNLWFAEKARMESLSQFGHLHFLFPEIFKDLNNGIMLGDDVIVQRDLSFLGNLNMGGKVNGTVEFWGVRLDQVRNLLGKITYDPKSCAWMSGVNVINLDKWRKHKVTENHLLLLKKFKTKVGVTVAKSIEFKDRAKNVGALIISDSSATAISSLLAVQKDLPIQYILPRRRIVASRQRDHKVPVDVFYLTLRISLDDFPQYEEFKHILIEVVQICQQDKMRQLSVQAYMNLLTAYLEYIISYLVHVLTHDPACPNIEEYEDVKAYGPIYWLLHLFLSSLLGEEDWQHSVPGMKRESFTTIVSIFRSVKCSKDVVDLNKTKTLQAICDLGILIAKRLCQDHINVSETQMVPLSTQLYGQNENSVDSNEQMWLGCEDDVHKSVKYNVWASTPNGFSQDGPVGTDGFMSFEKPTRPVLKVRKLRVLVDITPAVFSALLMNELQWIGLIVKPIDYSLKDGILYLDAGAGLKIERVPIDNGKIKLPDWAIDVITLVWFPIHAIDIVLNVTQMLRKRGVVGKFVEFYGEGMGKLSLADRATIANMLPEYGAAMDFFPVDYVTLDYLKLTDQSGETVSMMESYLRANKMFVDYNEPQTERVNSSYLELDLTEVEPSTSGPKRPHNRVPLKEIKSELAIAEGLKKGLKPEGNASSSFRPIAIDNRDEREILARDTFSLLTKIPDPADLSIICKRFEHLRFYEAVLRLPLQKTQTFDSIADVYGPWKRKCLAEFGIVNDQYLILTHVLLQINAKLGGINSLLQIETPPAIPFVSKVSTIILGMDVSHGSPGQSDVPSIAAVVSSREWSLISKFKASVRYQSPKLELRDSLFKPQGTEDDGLIRELLINFYSSSGKRTPDQIINFRDGVDKSQFTQVLNIELDQIIEVCKFLDENWSPKFTLIVAQKHHHTKFFLPNSSDSVFLGTVVDNIVCHPKNYDLYMCSHVGMIGTTRPTHYHILHDDICFSPEDLQELVHSLSHVYQRSTTAISVVTPICYAHSSKEHSLSLLPD